MIVTSRKPTVKVLRNLALMRHDETWYMKRKANNHHHVTFGGACASKTTVGAFLDRTGAQL